MQYLRIINVDGTRGCGKSTQINLLANYLKQLGISVLVNDVRNAETAHFAYEKTLNFLQASETNIVINNGSIARPVLEDLVSGTSKEEVESIYKNYIFNTNQLYFEYGAANLLLVLEDLDCANSRIAKKNQLLKTETPLILDQMREKSIVEGMMHFDDHVLSKNMEFIHILIDASDSMLAVRQKITDYLNEHFEIKKP